MNRQSTGGWAARSLQHGLAALRTMSTPDSTFLQIGSLDNKLQAQLQKPQKDITPVTTVAQSLNEFFLVQWGTPAGTTLTAAKLMAISNKMVFYDTRNTRAATNLGIEAQHIIENALSKAKAQQHPQTANILARLTPYKASIGQ
ncbi:Hypothetical protein PHPALM_12797 [Phytophthora palmivora]|uniref:Uncharacterized protein n=1 Tax=Phytophthora palmivora TaxID=4796 RepID=A0A2P4XYU4_9STRA|nr:Hypothetical protein PHPALM_12797 [Phytophthora palmivora]